MKIGVLTLPLHTNYGGLLQAYALQTVLTRMGHDALVLDSSPFKHLSLTQKITSYSKRAIKKYLLRKGGTIFIEEQHNTTYPIISQFTQSFIDHYIRRSEINNLSTLPKNSFDVLIVGSDQIWRPRYYPDIEDAYLEFAKSWNVKRLSYAPSFGTDEWEYDNEQTAKCASLLNNFDAVSVREASAVHLCEKHFGITPTHVLDPTFLLEPSDYMHIINESGIGKSKGTLLNYILDETNEKEALVKKIAAEKALIPFRVNSKVENPNAPLEERIQPPLEQWLRGFYDAEVIVTDSFHACVFAIIFNKPFWVVGNKARGMARFESLLGIFGLKERLVCESDSYNDFNPALLNWDTINNKVKELKKSSIAYLERTLI